MPKRAKEDARLVQLTNIALALPESERKLGGRHAQFLIRKKTFAYFLDDHHGDGIVAVTCKVLPGYNKALAAQILSAFARRVKRLGRAAPGRGQNRLGRGERTTARQLHADCTEALSGASQR